MSPDIDISLQLPIDPSDGKGLAILNKHTLLRIAQIFYQKETNVRQARPDQPRTWVTSPPIWSSLLAYLHSQQMIRLVIPMDSGLANAVWTRIWTRGQGFLARRGPWGVSPGRA